MRKFAKSYFEIIRPGGFLPCSTLKPILFQPAKQKGTWNFLAFYSVNLLVMECGEKFNGANQTQVFEKFYAVQLVFQVP